MIEVRVLFLLKCSQLLRIVALVGARTSDSLPASNSSETWAVIFAELGAVGLIFTIAPILALGRRLAQRSRGSGRDAIESALLLRAGVAGVIWCSFHNCLQWIRITFFYALLVEYAVAHLRHTHAGELETDANPHSAAVGG